jgi:hypothetical protein
MKLRSVISGDSQTAARQQYITRAKRLIGLRPSDGRIVVPGACTCCEGCSSCTSAW